MQKSTGQEVLNKKYQELAAIVTDRQIKIEALEAEQKNARESIKALELVAPLFLEIEKSGQETDSE